MFCTEAGGNFVFMLHAVCAKNEIFHSFDFSPTNVPDVNYHKGIKEIFQNHLLISDRWYISKKLRVDLFNNSKVNLSVPGAKSR